MPPKPKGKGGPKDKKAKKPKLTKAEKEKLKKEEAEQKAKEEEEARLLAEQAELERIEQERIEAEERRLLEETERVRHQAEIDELNKQLEQNKEYLLELKKLQLQKDKWDRYMLCDGRPDPTSKKEINSFINLTRENEEELEFEKVLKTCELILELIEELDENILQVQDELTEVPWSVEDEENESAGRTEGEERGEEDVGEGEETVEPTEEENKKVEERKNRKNTIRDLKSTIQSHVESKQDLQNLINDKLDQATFALLKSPGAANIDPDDLNIERCEETANLKVCVWGNAAKNPRVKQITFLKDSFSMELPKQMVILDIGLSVLYMNFDPFSCKSKFFYPRPEKKVVEELPVPLIDIGVESAATMQNDDGGGVDGGGLKANDGIKSAMSVALSAKNVLSTKEANRSGSRAGTAMSITNSIQAGSKIGVEEASKLEIGDGVDGGEADAIVENKNNVLEEVMDEDVVDLRLFSPIGRLIHVHLLQLPPQAKEVGGWMMQQVVKGGLTKIPFPPDEEEDNNLPLAETVSQPPGNNLDNPVPVPPLRKKESSHAVLHIDYKLPLSLSLVVDEKVMYHEDPLIARWDERSNNWKLDGITETEYDTDSRTLSFRTAYLGSFALLQDKYLSLPFQTWHLRACGLNHCVLNLISATVEVNIHIKEGECCVQFPDEDLKQVAHVAGRWMKPVQLIQALRSVGINLFPYEDGHKYVKIYPKDNALVGPMYQYMALLSSCYSFMLSRWNTECGPEKVVLQALEWLQPKSPEESPHGLYYATTRICYPLNISEDADEFSKDFTAGSSMHPDLYHMLRNGASSKARERMKETSVIFIQCVHQLLQATDFLVYS